MVHLSHGVLLTASIWSTFNDVDGTYQRHQIADLADEQLPSKAQNGRGASSGGFTVCMQALGVRRSDRGAEMSRGKGSGDEKTVGLVFISSQASRQRTRVLVLSAKEDRRGRREIEGA